MTKKTNSGKKIRLNVLGYALLAFVVFLFVATLVFVYGIPHKNATLENITERLPYPIAVIGYKETVSLRALADNIQSVKRFYENQDFSKVGLRVDFSTDEGKKRFLVRKKEVFNKMIEDATIMLLARERGITITKEAVNEGVRRKLDEYGSEENVKKDLERLYGWTLDDFENKVVLPSLYEEKLQERFLKEEDTTSQAETKIHLAETALKSGTDFDKVANQYSDGRTAGEGGDLGWFVISDLAPELRGPVLSQKIGITGSVIESSLGYHILLIEEEKKENGAQLYHLKQVFAKKKLFADWLSEQMRAQSIFILSPDFRWNADTAQAEFRDETMRAFEWELYEKTSGDAAFFF